MQDHQERFTTLIGDAALAVWGYMPRDIQEALFETAMKGRDADREDFARLLHARHPRTVHPPGPD
jgi:class 3 adenylate cyclase